MKGEVGHPARHYVYGLADGEGTNRFVGIAQHGTPAPWRQVWRFQHELPESELAAWFRCCPTAPTEVLIIGSCGLHHKAATALRKILATWFPACLKRSTPTRAIGEVQDDGTLRLWPTVKDAARALGVGRATVYSRINAGSLFDAS